VRGRLRRWPAALTLLVVSLGFAQVDSIEGFTDPELDARYRDLIHSIRCMQCQNQSIAESPSIIAADLRHEVRAMMAEGQSNREIRDYLASRYGDFINFLPPWKPSTWLLWTAPALLLLGGGFVFARILRSRMGQPMEELE
jgi:cytochrome c-type biogenesis protein CcmH